MQWKDLRIAIVSDSRNQCIAETYLSLLKDSSFSLCHCSGFQFDLLSPERASQHMERKHLALAQIGMPGRADYQKYMHTFLSAYIEVAEKPAVGILTHDVEHTRYIIDRWLQDHPQAGDLPEGALSIVDASHRLQTRSLEKALGILINGAAVLPLPRQNIPFTRESAPRRRAAGQDH